MKLDDLEIYKYAMDLGEKIWEIVMQWQHFEKNNMGSQLVRSCDSIAANISEGWGRQTYRENRNFLYIARGSLFETKTWLTKAFNRKLVSAEYFETLANDFNILGIKLNRFITANEKNISKTNNAKQISPKANITK
jgi:four helix bundle protein